jgi:hypothetical protein
MRAAGGIDEQDPVPARSRDALQAILTICHRVCLSPELSAEWKRHQSRFARGWLTQVYARRKVIRCDLPPCGHILDDLRIFPRTTQADFEAIAKDIHLFAAALATPDAAVLSGDNRVAAAIRKVCTDTATATSRVVAHVLWINPVADHMTLHAWMLETGPAQPHWRLGTAPRVRRKSTRRGQQ